MDQTSSSSVEWTCDVCGIRTRVHARLFRLHSHRTTQGSQCIASHKRILNEDTIRSITAAADRARLKKGTPRLGKRDAERERKRLRAARIAEREKSTLYSDRAPETSVRAVSGGLPGTARH